MTDKMIDRIKAAQKEHLECFDKFGNWIPGKDVSPLEEMADEMAERILADAEALKAADELAVVANNTGCATQEDADKLRAKIAAYYEKRGERE